jgi:thioredoxin 1
MIITLNKNNFSDYISKKNKETLFLVKFWADWCGPCKSMKIIFKEFFEKNRLSNIRIAEINIEKDPSLSKIYKIFSIPTIIFFKEGKEIDRIVGLVELEKLQKIVKEKIKKI